MAALELLTALGERTRDELFSAGVLARAGFIRLEGPRQTLGTVGALRAYGGVGAATAIAAARTPERRGLVDDLGEFSFGELDRRVNCVANGLRARGLKSGDAVAILARNHRGFIDGAFGAAKCGARVVFLNTDFAGPQIREVAEREGARLLICDEEYVELLAGYEPPLGHLRSWAEEPGQDTLQAMIDAGDPSPPPAPDDHSSVVILTSGTTGTPKGARREEPKSLIIPAALFSKVPFRGREVTSIPAPLFHALGFAHLIAALALGSTVVVRRRFSPEGLLEDIEAHGVTATIVVPVMLRRVLALGLETVGLHDTTPLRIIFVGGSQLGAELCKRTMAAFGPVVYNLYGSTEVGYATIATPEDLRVAPDCVGRTPRGATVRILDFEGGELPTGETGRIFVSNGAAFEGYTGGGTKEVLDGLMSSGDVGHFDSAGRLFIDGRDDDMIVSGGENVFPGEIEELLQAHAAVHEATVIGVPDEKFGQRLAAHVVLADGQTLTEDEVRDHVRDNLARFKVPRDVHFLAELPRNPTGKIVKRELPGVAG